MAQKTVLNTVRRCIPVHAWSVENGICLGQMACGEKTNEITGIPKILDLLEVRGSIITIDAMGTQIAIAEKIV